MQLREEDIREFQALWKEEFHEAISVADARERASALMELCLVLAAPLRRLSPGDDGSATTTPTP